jgi:hypothetical protein
MTVHLRKLCVGAETIDDLRRWIDERQALAVATGKPVEQTHTTRSTPKRREEILDGGSLYWIIKGQMQVRQPILALRPVVDSEGIKRCQIVLEQKLIVTQWRPHRPFQGWRYLEPKDAPRDLALTEEELSDDLRRELAELGLV